MPKTSYELPDDDNSQEGDTTPNYTVRDPLIQNTQVMSATVDAAEIAADQQE